jgi:hypothetical protein|tara:strand:- start:671 stop:1006 length:336 start_codon:yes stop_codon:yes gene_type:complete
MFKCTNDRYSNTDVLYDSVEDFQSMCEAVHGERADLYADGSIHCDYATGETVLVPAYSYTIHSADGDVMGIYEATDEDAAILAYVRDAGYRCVASAADVDPSVAQLMAVAS